MAERLTENSFGGNEDYSPGRASGLFGVDLGMRRAEVPSTTFDMALAVIGEEAREAERVILEGPPIYLWPRPENPTERLDNRAVATGWILTDAIAEMLGDTQHFMLVDDYNNRPANTTVDVRAQLAHIVAAIPSVRGLAILRGGR